MRKASMLGMVIAVSCILVNSVYAVYAPPTVITQWDFESDTSNDPSIGSGSFWLEGGASWTGGLNLGSINMITPGTGIGDGVGWAVSTQGYDSITLSLKIIRWDGFSGARDWSWAYFDGTNWIDAPDFHVDSYSTGDIETFDLTGLAGAADNSNFKFRVTRTTSSTYANLTVKFDDVTVSGYSIPEPATMVLLGLGAAAMFVRRKA